MKKRTILLMIVFVASLVVWLLFRVSPQLAPSSASSPTREVPGQAPAANQTTQVKGKEMNAEDLVADAKTIAEAQRLEQQLANEHNTPIIFYGLVQDQEGQSVPQAEVHFMNGDTPDGNWTWKLKAAEANGAFVLNGIRGRRLDVKVRHSNYYLTPDSQRSFVYAGYAAGMTIFKPDPARPEIFRLRKKGEAAELIRDIEQILFNPDEKERSFSLYDHSRRRDQPDYIIIHFVDKGRINSRGKPVLDLELSVPKGGIQPRTDPFQFTAPTTGYQSSLIPPPDVGVNFKDYFVRFDSGNYGRFTISGNSGQFDVESYLNPDQSPNLEYDPAKEITFIRNGRMGIDLLYPASDDPNKPTPKSTPSKPVERPGGTLIERRRNAAPPPIPPRG